MWWTSWAPVPNKPCGRKATLQQQLRSHSSGTERFPLSALPRPHFAQRPKSALAGAPEHNTTHPPSAGQSSPACAGAASHSLTGSACPSLPLTGRHHATCCPQRVTGALRPGAAPFFTNHARHGQKEMS